MMFYIEIKSYLQAYKELLCFLAAGIIISTVLYAGFNQLSQRGSLFEPFTVGVVDNDGTPELIFIYDFFNEYVIDLQFMDIEEAHAKLNAGNIPAFIELPENFTHDVFHSINSPFTVHVDRRFNLQGNLVQLLATGGISYLSVSQAGVYATLGYAFDAGMPWEEIQRALLIPVNMAFAQELLRYDDMFVREVVPLVQGSIADYFLSRFAVFWHVLSLLALINFLPWYSPGIMARFKVAGVPLYKVFMVKFVGLFVAVFGVSLFIVPLVGLRGVLLSSVFVAVLGLLSGRLFYNSASRSLFIFFVALGMYFASGGVVPFVFLPQELAVIRIFSINYWVAMVM